MAGSRRQVSLSTSVDGGHIPSRTPSPLGWNDQSDPNTTTLLGDTPGSLGLFDGADPTLPQFSSADPGANLVCIDPTLTPLAIGFDNRASAPATAPTPPAQYIALEDAQVIALKISTYFEGAKSLDYQAVSGDFHKMGMSFGLIQWNFGQNTLGPLLKMMLDKDPTAFKNCFGEGTDYDTLEKALKSGNQNEELKWARSAQKSNRSAWEAGFRSLGSVAAFQKIQLDQAVGGTHSLAVAVIAELRGISSSLFANIELRSYCAIFDLCIQQHGISKSLKETKKKIKEEKPASQNEAMQIVVKERARKASKEWVSDCISRRMGILTGAAYESTENKVTKKRDNRQFSLLADDGSKYVSGL
jgi:hypothetical protein